MQYTGLKDKNGQEIYEGDILFDNVSEEHCEVAYDEGGFQYDPPQLSQAKEKLKAHLVAHIPPKMFTGPTRLIVRWLFPIKAKNLFQNGQYKTTKPDTDNLNKAFKDILEKLKFVKNDAIICSELIKKFWADIPGIYVELQDINQDFTEKIGGGYYG